MKILLITAICCIGHSFAFAQSFTLDKFLNGVKNSNDGLSALEIRQKAFKEIEAEAELLYTTQLETSVNYTDDQRPTTTSSFQGNQTKIKTGNIGLSKNNSYGTNFSVSYNISQTQIEGASSALVPQNKFHENYTKVEFSQSLLKNALGSEIQARENLIRSNARSNSLTQEYRSKVLLTDAENIYYQLLIATESLLIQEESLKRAKNIESYIKKRLKKKLADKTDHLQALGVLKQRELEFQMAKDEKRKITQLFNSYLGINSSQSVNMPYSKELENITTFSIQKKPVQRLDTKASEFNLLSVRAQQKVNLESLKPDLKLIGSASLYGRRNEFNDTLNDSLGSKNPVYAIGINFTIPLDFNSRKKAKSAYNMNINAAKKEYQRKVFEEQNEWDNLKNQYVELNRQLEILSELEVIQKQKLDNEIKVQKSGRSTTFQVLNFEQEYLSAQLRKIQLKSNLAKTYTQLKLFN